jgi:hypothetical protein
MGFAHPTPKVFWLPLEDIAAEIEVGAFNPRPID